MMAVEKENFKIGDKTFQIIEVKEAEQPQPDYSHLVGKWLKYTSHNNDFIKDKWYKCIGDIKSQGAFLDMHGNPNGFFASTIDNTKRFDITNPQDTNPDEVKKILVPKEIVISEDVDGLNLHFGNNQALYVYKGADGYGVLSEADREPIQCELIKCERAELKKGDLAFRSDSKAPHFTRSASYCVIINDSEYCFANYQNSVLVDSNTWNHWYKLQPIQ